MPESEAKTISYEDAQELISKRKKKGEELVTVKKISYPYWIIEYGYSVEKGIIKKYKETHLGKIVIDGITKSILEKSKITTGNEILSYPDDNTVIIPPETTSEEIENLISNKIEEFKKRELEIQQPTQKNNPAYKKELSIFKRSINFPTKLDMTNYIGIFKIELKYYRYWVGCLLKRKKNIRRFITIDEVNGKENKRVNEIITQNAKIQKRIINHL